MDTVKTKRKMWELIEFIRQMRLHHQLFST